MTFEFFSVPRIVFGRGQAERVGELARSLGTKPLVVYNGEIEPIGEIVHRAGLDTVIVRQRGEPKVQDIDAALELARRERCDCVVGIGGGSAIDAAKAVAGLLSNGGVASDYMEVVGKGLKITKPAAPWIAVPTTAGTGAEVTRNAVVGWPEKKFKASIRSEHLMARAAVIDPELQVEVPADVTARSGMDALCQCIEAYVSKGATPMTDAIAIKGVALAARSLRRAYDNGRDLDAREGMALAALLGGIALTNAGLGAVHGFAAPLGANFPVPHGTVCGVLLPQVIRANLQSGDGGVRRKYADVGRAMADDRMRSEDEAAQHCVDFTASLVAALKLPSLGTFGIRRDDVGEMVSLAKKASSMKFNPVSLSDEALAAVLMRGIGTL